MALVEVKKVQQIKREGSIKGEGGPYKDLKIPALPPKLPSSGITFHYCNIEHPTSIHFKLSPFRAVTHLILFCEMNHSILERCTGRLKWIIILVGYIRPYADFFFLSRLFKGLLLKAKILHYR